MTKNQRRQKRLWVFVPLLLCMVSCGTVQKKEGDHSKGFRTVPPPLIEADWERTPTDVLSNPVEDEPLIWAGIVAHVYVRARDGRVEVEWLCKHLRFCKPGPRAISVRPVEVKEGEGYFSLALRLKSISLKQAERFQKEHVLTPHYMLAGGTLKEIVEREGRKVPLLQVLRFGLGRDLAVLAD
ncbi:MAG: hypothetical protein SWE60_06170 [Thermodesulfobacteriota bacterium]|nr:hypothetical protein [Thermodesulfobacteriota bacterium]